MNYFYAIAAVCMLMHNLIQTNPPCMTKWPVKKQSAQLPKYETIVEQLKKTTKKITNGATEALFMAVSQNNTKEVESLLNSGYTPHLFDFWASWSSWIKKEKSFPNINARSRWGWSPLSLAAMRNSKDIVQLLLRAGANPNIEDKQGETPLSYAAQRNNPEIVKMLLRAQAQPTSRFWQHAKLHAEILKAIAEYNDEVEQERKAIEQATMDAFPEEGGWQHMSQIIAEYAARSLQEPVEIKEKMEVEHQ